MLDNKPQEPEWRSWTYVAIGVLIIFCTIPVARAARELVAEHLGINTFLYISVTIAVLLGLWGYSNLKKRRLPVSARLCLVIIVASMLAYMYHLRDIPEEAIHVAEYGAIGILIFRALSHRVRDYSIYLLATLMVGIIGIVDEYIQWVVPSRYFDFRDIRTNFLAGGMGQLALLLGLRPRLVSSWPDSASWRRVCHTLVVVVIVLSLGLLNTPERISWYATAIPGLGFLMESRSMMTEYGYRYEDSEIGVFRSRFSLRQLEHLNQTRGSEAAAILDSNINTEVWYSLIFKHYTVPRDPYIHEISIHMFRRDRYFDRASEEPDRAAEFLNVAYRENLILEKYFTNAVTLSRHRWSPEHTTQVANGLDSSSVYESAVSAGIITRFSEAGVIMSASFVIVTLLILGQLTRGKIRLPRNSN